jgi:hypothetical protein
VNEDHPVRVTIADDLQRSRLTVFFRLLLAIPHFVWLLLWGLVAGLFSTANWIATLITGRSPDAIHDFLVTYIRYITHVNAYVFLAADPYPGFAGRKGSYPVDVEIAAPQRQNRWKTGFRLFLALPALMLAATMFGTGGGRTNGYTYAGGVLGTAAFLGWFAIMVRGRMPRGLRDAVVWGLAYSVQLDAYLFVLTDRYPDSDPVAVFGSVETPLHPVRLAIADDLRRSRLTVLLRLLLVLPHIVWLLLWGIVAFVAVVANWFATLFAGHSPASLHRFISAYVCYQTHVAAFFYLVANPFPGFSGRPGSYPVEVTIGPPERQSRWRTGFRLVLMFPALLLNGAFGGVLSVVALFGWFTGLFIGRMPLGLRNAGAVALRYQTQVNAYLYLLTDRYPYSSPAGLEVTAPPSPTPPPPGSAPISTTEPGATAA